MILKKLICIKFTKHCPPFKQFLVPAGQIANAAVDPTLVTDVAVGIVNDVTVENEDSLISHNEPKKLIR